MTVTEYPFHNWNGYLKWQAGTGNETALALLRSRKLEPTSLIAVIRRQEAYKEGLRGIKLTALEKELRIATSSITGKPYGGLIAITRMERLAAQEALQRVYGKGNQDLLFSGYKHVIDNNGIVIFKLVNGGTIRDTGRKVNFSCDECTHKAAMIYGQMRFGKGIQLKGNTIERKPYGKQDRYRAGNHKSHFAFIKQICRNGLRTLSELHVVRFGQGAKMFLPGHARPDLER